MMGNKITICLAHTGLTANTKKLMRGLFENGVAFEGIVTTSEIRRNHAQGTMNMRAGEAAPTWFLRINMAHMFGRAVESGKDPIVHYKGEQFVGVQSHMPLKWILKHDPAEWDLGRDDDGVSLHIDVPNLPPHW